MLISFLSVTGVKIFISWIKKTWEERKHLQASVCFQQVTSEASLLPHLLLPTWIVLLGLSATSFLVTLCCTWVPIHGSLALHRRLKIYMYIYISQRFCILSPDLYLRIKGEIYLLWVMGIEELGTFHWQRDLAKIVLVDFEFIWLILSPLVKWNYFCLGNTTSCFLCHFSSD